MARNEEKAQAMLNRWVSMKRQLGARQSEHRPSLTSACDSISDGERWRHQIVREIIKRVQEIQNAGLGEHKIRELNDEINRLLREKEKWEARIKELGGADYKKSGSDIVDAQGVELPGSGSYKYFGAAKDLPGVRELFTREKPNAPKKGRADLYRSINFSYYGIEEKEDPEMLEEEERYEKIQAKKDLDRWIEENKEYVKMKLKGIPKPTQEQLIELVDDESIEEFKKQHATKEALHQKFQASEKDNQMQKELERRKKALLEKLEALNQNAEDPRLMMVEEF